MPRRESPHRPLAAEPAPVPAEQRYRIRDARLAGPLLRQTAYDVAAACATLAGHGYPGIENWLDAFVQQTYSNAEALAVFAPRDGRSST